MAYATLGVIQLFHAFNSKSIHGTIFSKETFNNKYFNIAVSPFSIPKAIAGKVSVTKLIHKICTGAKIDQLSMVIIKSVNNTQFMLGLHLNIKCGSLRHGKHMARS